MLAVFFLGLALGGFCFGRIAQRSRRPLRAAATLEAGLALLVLLTIPAFGWIDDVYGAAYRALGAGPMLAATRALLVALLLLPPAFLMGGTLPLFARRLVRDPGRVGGAIAGLYALNTLGAAAGALLAGFVLIPELGLNASLGLAAALNTIAATLAIAAGGDEVAPAPERAPATVAPRGVRVVVMTLVFAAGLVALGQEVLWTRFLALVALPSVRTWSLTLALVLIGIVAGSLAVARLADRARPRAFLYGALQVASGLLVLALMRLSPAWWRGLPGELPAAATLLVPAAILSGAAFPLAVRMVVATPEWAGLGIGTMSAVNTLGGILGALLVGFLVLPGPGLAVGIQLCAVLSVAAGLTAWIWLDRSTAPAPRIAWVVVAIAAWAALAGTNRVRIPADFLADRARLMDWREGKEANLAVVRGASGERVLEIDRWWQGQDRRTHQIMAAHLPMLLHPAPRRVVVVGVGAGQTPMRFTMHPLESLECVDIEPRVFELVRADFPSAWMEDPRVRLLELDGRNHLTHGAGRYDLVSLEVGQLSRPGVASFYTVDFYRRARARLSPGGVISQFVALAFLTPAELRDVVATFLAVFPRATLWYNTSELLLVGGRDDIPRLLPDRVAAALADTTIAGDLDWSPWGGPREWLSRPEVLAGSFLCGPRGLVRLADGGRIARDERPRLEYAAARNRGDEGRELLTLPLLLASLDPIVEGSPGLDAVTARSAETMRERHLADMVAAVHLRGAEAAVERGEPAAALPQLERAVAANPGNLIARRQLGALLLAQGRVAEAERRFEEARAISDRDPHVRAGLGVIALQRGRFAEAASQLRASVGLEPGDPEARNALGAALGQLGDLAGALEQFERAAALRPGYEEAQRNAAQVRAALEARGATPPPRPKPPFAGPGTVR